MRGKVPWRPCAEPVHQSLQCLDVIEMISPASNCTAMKDCEQICRTCRRLIDQQTTYLQIARMQMLQLVCFTGVLVNRPRLPGRIDRGR